MFQDTPAHVTATEALRRWNGPFTDEEKAERARESARFDKEVIAPFLKPMVDHLEKFLMSNVTHPSHYNAGRFEVIEVIEDQKLGFNLGNAIKYICRAGKKDPGKHVEDLEKAEWYIRRELELLRAKRDERQVVRPNDMNARPKMPPCIAAGCSQEQQKGRDYCMEHGPVRPSSGGCDQGRGYVGKVNV